MAGVTALRDAAREAMLAGGGRGFVRFLPAGDALLVCDAPRRMDGETETACLAVAFEAAGFSCRIEDGLAFLTPGTERLLALCALQPDAIAADSAHPLFEAMALCDRLLREAPLALDAGAHRLLLETARLLWLPREQTLRGIPALRARIAVRLREKQRSGLHECGRLLCGWIRENRD